MQKILTVTLFSLLLLGQSTGLMAQQTVKDGKIRYETTFEGDVSPMAALMKAVQATVWFEGDKGRMEINAMGGMMKAQAIFNTNTKKGILLMDAFGNKTATTLDEATLEKLMPSDGKARPKLDVTYKKSDTKTVGGYICYRAEIKTSEGVDVAYICETISPTSLGFAKDMFKGLDGLPLEYTTIDKEGVKTTVKAMEVSADKPASSNFEMKIPEGYKEITPEEMEKMLQNTKMPK